MKERTIIFAGEAGRGIDRTAVLFGRTLIRDGIHAFIYRDYSSLIRGGHNFSVVSFSENPIKSHSDQADVLVAFDVNSVNLHKNKLKTGGIIITTEDFGIPGATIIPIYKLASQLKLSKNFGNNVILGTLADIFEINDEALKSTIEESFVTEQKDSVNELINSGKGIINDRIKIGRSKFNARLIDGNEAIVNGAKEAGLQIAFYYPMTPATGVFSKLIETANETGITVSQLEDEIAVANAGIGASYAGATTMIGSSGGGLALMGEVVSLSGMAEIPLVIYAAQRLGPSTGVPTYTAQGDLRFVMHMGPGEFTRLVLVPGDTEEAHYQTKEAFYFARKYRIPVFILSDKHLAESYFETRDVDASDFSDERFIEDDAKLSYEITADGLSPRSVPGGINLARVTSYEHDEAGYTTEDATVIKAMGEKRLRKGRGLELEMEKTDRIKMYGEGTELLIVSAGSTKGAVLDVLREIPEARFMQILCLDPFPSDEVLREIDKYKRVVIIENNLTGALSGIIREKTGFLIEEKILKYDGRPFTAKEIIDGLLK